MTTVCAAGASNGVSFSPFVARKTFADKYSCAGKLSPDLEHPDYVPAVFSHKRNWKESAVSHYINNYNDSRQSVVQFFIVIVHVAVLETTNRETSLFCEVCINPALLVE